MRKLLFKTLVHSLVEKQDFLTYSIDLFKFYFLQSPNIVILLNEFLQTEKIINLSDHEDVTYEDFVSFLSNITVNAGFYLLKDELKRYLSPADVLQLTQPKVMVPANSRWDKQPVDTKNQILSYLTKSELLFFNQTSKDNYLLSIDIDSWKEKIFTLGNTHLMNQIPISAINAIKNYKNLYRVLHYLPHRFSVSMDEKWHLFCLSGDPSAIEFGIKKGYLYPRCKDAFRRNILHLAALSGIPSQIDKALALGLDPFDIDIYGRTIMHYAALSGIPEQFDKAVSLGLDPKRVDNNGRTAAHYCAWSGAPQQLKKAAKAHLDLTQKDNNGRTPMHYAAWSGKAPQLVTARRMGLYKLALDDDNRDIRHYAILSGVPAQLTLSITELNNNNLHDDAKGVTGLHLAALSGSPRMLDTLLGLQFSIAAIDKSGRNLMHFAVLSWDPKQIKRVQALGISPLQTDHDDHDAFWHAKNLGLTPALAIKALQEADVQNDSQEQLRPNN